MARKSNQEIGALCKEKGVDRLWSFSRYNLFQTDRYSYFLKYIKNVKEDRDDDLYGKVGGLVHDLIESAYLGKVTKDEMVEQFEDSMFNFYLEGRRFDRSDEDKHNAIAEKYEYSVKHYLKNYQFIDEKMYLEKFVITQIGEEWFQGYVDAFHQEERDGKKCLIITDWKTSTKYSGAKIPKEGKQLMLYAKALHEMANAPYDRIIIRWCFLKYCTLTFKQMNGKTKSTDILRYELGTKARNPVKTVFKTLGYSESEYEQYLMDIELTNDLSCLPQDVKDNFEVTDCYVEIPFDENTMNELIKEVSSEMSIIRELEKKYAEELDDSIFFTEVTQNNSYYLANLCNYSSKLHKPYAEYLENLKMFSKDIGEELTDDDLDALLNDI